MLQEYQLNLFFGGNGTSELNIGVFAACLEMWQIHGCTRRQLCDGPPSLAPMFSATDLENSSSSQRAAAVSNSMPSSSEKHQWFILAIGGDTRLEPSHRTIYLLCALLPHSTWSTPG